MKTMKILLISLVTVLISMNSMGKTGKIEKTRKPAASKNPELENILSEFLGGKFQIINPKPDSCHDFEITLSDIKLSLTENLPLEINSDRRGISININESIPPMNIDNCLFKAKVAVKVIKDKAGKASALKITDEMTFGSTCSKKDQKEEYYLKSIIADKNGINFTIMSYPMENDQVGSKLEKTEDCTWKKLTK